MDIEFKFFIIFGQIKNVIVEQHNFLSKICNYLSKIATFCPFPPTSLTHDAADHTMSHGPWLQAQHHSKELHSGLSWTAVSSTRKSGKRCKLSHFNLEKMFFEPLSRSQNATRSRKKA